MSGQYAFDGNSIFCYRHMILFFHFIFAAFGNQLCFKYIVAEMEDGLKSVVGVGKGGGVLHKL